MRARLPGLFLALTAVLLSQEVDATVAGEIRSEDDNPLANVQITLTNLSTEITRETVTDPAGRYAIRFLQAGTYSIAVSSEGHEPNFFGPFFVRPGQILRLDLALRGNGAHANAPDDVQLGTDSAAVRRLVEPRNIRDLPLNGRDFIQLPQLLAGVFPGTPGSITVTSGRGSIGETSPETGVTGLAANGARDTANRYFLDGVEFFDFGKSSYPFAVSVDSLAEVKVETSTYSALYGAANGGQVDLVTRSGGARYQGTLWAFNRNDFFSQTVDAIAGRTLAPPRLNRNQFGANLGGPTSVPRAVSPESSSFFFINWESGRLKEGLVPGLRRVPPAAMREGDFRGLTDARTGEPLALRDPLGIGIVDNRVPAQALSPQALAFLDFVPLPNATEGAFNFRSGESRSLSRQDSYLGRLDHNLASANLITARYIFNQTLEAGTPFWGADQRDNTARGQNVLLQYTRTLSPDRINQLRAGWNRLTDRESFGTTGRPEFDVAGRMGLPRVSRRPADFGPPSIALAGPDGLYDVFQLQREGGPVNRVSNAYQISNVLSWRRGPHMIRLGGDWIRKYHGVRQARNPRGAFAFDGAYTGSALADFLLGYTRTASVAPTATAADLGTTWQSYFVQDDWRATSRLTVSMGLRWDYIPQFHQRDGRMINIEQDAFRLTRLVTAEESAFGKRMVEGNPTNFGPRLGFAWSPEFAPGLVIRTGYGMYFSPNLANAAFRLAEAAQETRAAVVQGAIGGIPDVFLSDPFASVPDGPDFNLAVSVDQYLRDTYTQQWNLTLERRVPLDFLFNAAYVGSKGTRLPVTLDDLNRPLAVADPRDPALAPLNERRPNPAFARPVEADKSIGTSTYHSLQASAFRSSPSGLELVLAYNWSKCMSGPADSSGMVDGGTYIGRPQDLYALRLDRALCGFDISHRFSGSVLYETAAFRSGPTPLKWLFDGWRIAAIPTLASGVPAPVFYGVDTTGIGMPSRPDRLDGLSGNLRPSERTWERWFRTEAFAPAPFGRFGTAPRTGAVRLPGIRNLDLSFARAFNFESRRVELRAEIFNVFNHFNPPPGSVDLNLQSQTFGAVGGGVQGITTRVIQLAAKIYF